MPNAERSSMFVKPAPGRSVRRSDTLNRLGPEGEEVPRDEFWLRRLRDGDVVECAPDGGEPKPPQPRAADDPRPHEEAAS